MQPPVLLKGPIYLNSQIELCQKPLTHTKHSNKGSILQVLQTFILPSMIPSACPPSTSPNFPSSSPPSPPPSLTTARAKAPPPSPPPVVLFLGAQRQQLRLSVLDREAHPPRRASGPGTGGPGGRVSRPKPKQGSGSGSCLFGFGWVWKKAVTFWGENKKTSQQRAKFEGSSFASRNLCFGCLHKRWRHASAKAHKQSALKRTLAQAIHG